MQPFDIDPYFVIPWLVFFRYRFVLKVNGLIIYTIQIGYLESFVHQLVNYLSFPGDLAVWGILDQFNLRLVLLQQLHKLPKFMGFGQTSWEFLVLIILMIDGFLMGGVVIMAILFGISGRNIWLISDWLLSFVMFGGMVSIGRWVSWFIWTLWSFFFFHKRKHNILNQKFINGN